MLFLGFSAGLPFMLVFSTLSAWLREEGIERATIGMLSWVGIIYSVKFFWAPVVDRLQLPFLGKLLGRRRSWMLVAQVGIAVGLANMAHMSPVGHLGTVAALALLVAFSSATQDISVDAWRIEAAPPLMQGAMAAAYQLGYRIAIMVASAGALWIAADHGWTVAYTTMAMLVGVGIVTTLVIPEPEPRVARESLAQEERVVAWLERKAHWPESLRQLGAWFVGAVVCPFLDFFSRYGTRLAILMLAFIASYRLADFTMGVMTNPFYLDLGFSLKQIAAIAKGFGVFMSILGTLIGGVAVARFGLVRTLVLGSVGIIVANVMFAVFAWLNEPSITGLAIVISADNVAMGIAGTALIAYLSSLTSASYTATQYALFSSMYALPGKLLMGASGFVVDAIGYPAFFVYTATLGLPALVMLFLVQRASRADGDQRVADRG
ncbi:MAG: AmpG family muropeptide MFS transporter [Gammaproteobacteria bacterium]|nr:AmpG family muropeptide MFS transporter [Gammaproteobacteria bacterium]